MSVGDGEVIVSGLEVADILVGGSESVGSGPGIGVGRGASGHRYVDGSVVSAVAGDILRIIKGDGQCCRLGDRDGRQVDKTTIPVGDSQVVITGGKACDILKSRGISTGAGPGVRIRRSASRSGDIDGSVGIAVAGDLFCRVIDHMQGRWLCQVDRTVVYGAIVCIGNDQTVIARCQIDQVFIGRGEPSGTCPGIDIRRSASGDRNINGSIVRPVTCNILCIIGSDMQHQGFSDGYRSVIGRTSVRIRDQEVIVT